MEYLVLGIPDYDEAGVFMAFEGSERDLTQNVGFFGYVPWNDKMRVSSWF